MQSAAARLELALHGQSPREVIEPLLDGCAGLLTPLIGMLNQWMKSDLGATAAPLAVVVAPDPGLTEKTLRQLMDLLAQSDTAAEQLWQQSGTQLRPLLRQRWDELDAALRNFDFDGALQLLREVAPGPGTES